MNQISALPAQNLYQKTMKHEDKKNDYTALAVRSKTFNQNFKFENATILARENTPKTSLHNEQKIGTQTKGTLKTPFSLKLRNSRGKMVPKIVK